jgi:hypothetical protein
MWRGEDEFVMGSSSVRNPVELKPARWWEVGAWRERVN